MNQKIKALERVIEKFFPFSKVNEIAYKESNAKRYYRPVLTLHKWFARRLGSVFRSILIYASLCSSKSESKDNLIQYEDYNPQEEKDFWNIYLQDYNFQELLVLDPFMGGGTTIIEAKRLGFKVIGGDLNPVAWFTVKKELDDVNLEKLQTEFEKLRVKLSNDLLQYYKTQCEICSKLSDVMYYFWIKEIQCDRCSENLSLFRGYLFAYNRKNTSLAYFICPECENIFQGSIGKITSCPECSNSFNPVSYIAKRGKYFCSHCGYSAMIVETGTKQGRPSERLYAVEYYCASCKTRRFKRADEEDFIVYQKACREFESIQDQLPIPNQTIPVGAKSQELINHQILSFDQMFNKRQLLSLGKLLKEILEIQNNNLREFFLITFSTALEYNNLLCEYHRKNHYIYNLFRKHAFPATLNPVENNVWGAKFGTGTFKNFFTKTLRIKEYCQNPYEYYIDEKGLANRKPMSHRIVGNTVSSYSNLVKDPFKNVYLYCNSSNQIHIPINSVDLVITDPPYYDNVQYAELSDFYYVWLRIGLKNQYPWFKPPLTPKTAEIVKNDKLRKTSEDYQEGLTKVFTEISRVLKKEGLLIFTFHHKQIKAWNSIIQSLLDNQFYIAAVYPVRGEMMTSTQIRGKKSIEFDVIFVCKKRLNQSTNIQWEELIPKIREAVDSKLNSLAIENKPLSKEDKFVIQLGVGLKYYTQYYPYISFNTKPFTLPHALENLVDLF